MKIATDATINTTIRVVNQASGQTATASQRFFYGPGLRITSINPNQVGFQGGNRVIVTGHGFDEPLTLTLDGIVQSLISVSGTEIIFNSSPFPGRACDSRVVTNHEGGASVTSSMFIVGPTSPVITGLNPNVEEHDPGAETDCPDGYILSLSGDRQCFTDFSNNSFLQVGLSFLL